MLTVEEALERVLRDVPRQPEEALVLRQAFGRVLARGLVAHTSVPPWDNSAMDGYAVRAADTTDGEVALRLLEMVGAGAMATHSVQPGTAIGVMTGAPVPQGADAVVMVEDTDGATAGTVRVRGRATAGQHIRREGEDLRHHQQVLEAGDVLTPAAGGLASSMGHFRVPVRKRVRVAILTTGDEIVQPGSTLRPGQIWGSNGVSLTGLALEAGAEPLDLGNAPDDPGAIREALHKATTEADLVVTTGGVSVGQYDFVRDVVAEAGGGLDFWKVRMKPGKPLAFGRAGDVPMFGLPGNPVSCMVSFLQFVRPWIRTALGDPRPFLPVVPAHAGADFHDKPGRARFLRVRLATDASGWVATPTGSQSSGVLTSMQRADGLLVLGVDAPPPRAGDPVRVQLLGAPSGGATPDFGW